MLWTHLAPALVHRGDGATTCLEVLLSFLLPVSDDSSGLET